MRRVFSFVSIILFLAGCFLLTRPDDIGTDLFLFNIGFIICAVGYIGILLLGIPFVKRYWHIAFWSLVIIPRIFAMNLIPSDDLARYVWEGKVLSEGYSPYYFPPESEELIQYRDDEIYSQINHKDRPAIYPPLAQYIFALISIFVKDIYGIRLLMIILELSLIMVMLSWLGNLKLPKERALIYALNPLVIIGIAGHGHLDPMQLLLLMIGMLLYSKGHRGFCIAFITLAGMIKFLALAVLPFFITRKTARYLPLVILIIIGCYFPVLFLKGGFSFGNLGVYLGKYEYYSLTFAPLRLMLGTQGAVWTSAIIIFLSGLGLWLTRTNPLQSIAPFFLIITLMSTTIHYWYLVPVLAFAVVWPSRYLIALSLLFLPHFDVFGLLVSENIWRGALWRQVITYAPFIVLLWIEMTGRWPRFRKKDYTIGAVIPVLNDAGSLKGLLGSLSRTGLDKNKIVVSDGGSDDGSVEVAREWGARIVQCDSPGRGHQIARGVEKLNTDLVVILHADNDVDENIFKRVIRAAEAYPHSAGGACRLIYKQRNLKMRLLSFLSDIKMSIYGASFGDQGQWFRKDKVEMPELPLMEDVELALRINAAGPAVWTRAKVYVSTRRYKKVGLLKGALDVVDLTMAYLFKRRWKDELIDTTDIYKRYYNIKS
jgi:hypothetical protein